MNVSNLLSIAFKALINNKLRAFLTALGIIIGVASVITMLAIGQGSKASINSRISEMGSNMIMIRPGEDVRGGVRQEASAMQTLKIEDLESIINKADLLSDISPVVTSSGQFVCGANNYPATITGVSQDYLNIRQLKMDKGAIFSDYDILTAEKVCVIGKTIADNLFPDGEDPVGKVIRFKTIPMRVVGVLAEKGYNTMGQDQDEIVLAPYTTIMKRVLAITYLNQIYASAKYEEKTTEAIEQVTEILRENHKLGAMEPDNFYIRSQQELAEMLSSTSSLMTTLLACVASISLIVGGIGIMNIMYVSVTERTKEIGLRMSVGARGIDILTQFLIEALMISISGGIIGVVLGCGSAWGVRYFANWPIQIEVWTIILSFAVCSFTGVFFGWYPAKKAAALNPIDAIRYE